MILERKREKNLNSCQEICTTNSAVLNIINEQNCKR